MLKHVEFLDFDIDNLFIGDLASDYRIVSTLKRWILKQYVDPPTLSLSYSKEKKISFSDGRHRFKISYFLGLKKIPVAVHITILPIIKQLMLVERL